MRARSTPFLFSVRSKLLVSRDDLLSHRIMSLSTDESKRRRAVRLCGFERAARGSQLLRSLAVLAGFALALALASFLLRASSESRELRRAAASCAALRASGVFPRDAIPVLLPAATHPAYLAATLAALSRARGVGATLLIASQDGDDAAVSAQLAAINFTTTLRLRHAPPLWGLPAALGLRSDAPTAANVFFLLRAAFDACGARAAIVLEADIEVAPDALDFFSWALDSAARDAALAPRLFTVSGFAERSAPPPPGSGAAEDSRLFEVATDEAGFMVWGWAAPAQSWPQLRAAWTSYGNWDFAVERWRRREGLISLAPAVSRTRHIGMQGINFNVQDAAEVRRWTGHYLPPHATEYAGREMRVRRTFGLTD